MNALKKAWIVMSALTLTLVLAQASQAQAINSNQATVNLNAVLAESLTVSASPATVNFTLAASGTSNGSAPVAITTTWALGKTRTSVKVYAYFTGTTALSDGAGDIIPTSSVLGSINSGAYAPFTGGAATFNVNSLLVLSQTIGAAGTFNSSHSDNVALQINTTGLALPAATYTGTLNVQAQAL
ncbi:MAG: hypothetical protein ABSA96_15590 [Candidatus Acidiferrales bacterium]|jgi:hypothetical protein